MNSLAENMIINKVVMRTAGVNEAIIYSELHAMYSELSRQNKLIKGEWFSYTIEDLEESSTLTRGQQSRAIKKLGELNLVELKRMGLPAKRYFKLNPLEKMVQ